MQQHSTPAAATDVRTPGAAHVSAASRRAFCAALRDVGDACAHQCLDGSLAAQKPVLECLGLVRRRALDPGPPRPHRRNPRPGSIPPSRRRERIDPSAASRPPHRPLACRDDGPACHQGCPHRVAAHPAALPRCSAIRNPMRALPRRASRPLTRPPAYAQRTPTRPRVSPDPGAWPAAHPSALYIGSGHDAVHVSFALRARVLSIAPRGPRRVHCAEESPTRGARALREHSGVAHGAPRPRAAATAAAAQASKRGRLPARGARLCSIRARRLRKVRPYARIGSPCVLASSSRSGVWTARSTRTTADGPPGCTRGRLGPLSAAEARGRVPQLGPRAMQQRSGPALIAADAGVARPVAGWRRGDRARPCTRRGLRVARRVRCPCCPCCPLRPSVPAGRRCVLVRLRLARWLCPEVLDGGLCFEACGPAQRRGRSMASSPL
ncbi:hypothetical protein PsYK624_104180 [Phanerochaete sordida]|uniref:Uncharacterized protein n=1 Tax=Phanerochaete sordida TaxID=48140 RepID=A0A9P3GIK4_9APHY|nr:hypothetical protein PsYK624_104180 [Phanerochaete sordida]